MAQRYKERCMRSRCRANRARHEEQSSQPPPSTSVNQLDAPDDDEQDDHLLLSQFVQCRVALVGLFWLPRSYLPKKKTRQLGRTQVASFTESRSSCLGITYSGISSWIIWGGRRGRIFFTRRLMSIAWAASTVGGVVVISKVQGSDWYATLTKLKRFAWQDGGER
jgi:hypothetical protein